MCFEEYAQFESNVSIEGETYDSHFLLYLVVSVSILIVSHLMEQSKKSIIYHDLAFCKYCYICKISKSESR